ncbi:MAG: TIGR01906 family membrane protein [Solobacterium sp.]|nr:TIGR01906 family membrane protein [Solobacterium sp.]
MKQSEKICSILSIFLLSLALLMTCIDVCSFRTGFYKTEYAKNDTSSYTGMSQEDNLKATMTLLDYLKDKRSDIVVTAKVNGMEREVFNERETLHMVDVKKLYQSAILVRNLCALAGALLFGYLLIRKHRVREILQAGFQKGNLLIGGIVLFIAIWALADFNAFWTNFHLFFFDNDLWLLDPRTSIMINLFPGSFFFDLVIQIILSYLGSLILIGLFTYWPSRRHA